MRAQFPKSLAWRASNRAVSSVRAQISRCFFSRPTGPQADVAPPMLVAAPACSSCRSAIASELLGPVAIGVTVNNYSR